MVGSYFMEAMVKAIQAQENVVSNVEIEGENNEDNDLVAVEVEDEDENDDLIVETKVEIVEVWYDEENLSNEDWLKIMQEIN